MGKVIAIANQKGALERRESEVINMSSILVSELKTILENVSEDYKAIMEITTGCDTKAGSSIAYILKICY